MEKKMFRYYQTGEKGAWHPITDSEDIESIAVGKGAKKLTILSLNELVNDGETDKLDLSYRGPLYFDIDCKNDLATAIESCQRLVKSLQLKGVNDSDIRVFCSGSKGFHILVPQKVFSNGRPQKRLPWIYREMALSLFVPGTDFQVYSTGRGNSFRIPQVQRADGKYRTPISLQELEEITPETYVELCEVPRETYKHPDYVLEKSTELEVLFESAKIRAGKRHNTAGSLADETLKKISREAPNCLRDLADFKKVAADKSFNALAMQVGILIARSGMEEEAYSPQIDRMAENAATGNTSRAGRREELESQVRYMKANPTYKFSCAAMRDLLTSRPCEGCPLEKEGSAVINGGADLGLEKRQEGYYFVGKSADVRLSTFTLTPISVVIDRPQDGSAPRRAYTVMSIESEGVDIGEVSFSEAGWKSASNFKDEISGLRNLAFMGSDDHVQRIKHMTYREEENSAGEIMQVYTAGIHIEERVGHKVFTYIEPGYSINSVKVEGTYRLKGRILCPPMMKETPVCPKGDIEADDAMLAMLKMNSPINMAQTVGWFAACHLKSQLVDMYNQFPILSVWGAAGSGKSKTVEVVSALCGLNPVKDAPVNVSTPTAYAILEYAASTTTVPRIMEEYNKSKMNFKAYTMVGETLKAAWGGETIAKGTLAKRSNQNGGRTGAYVEAIKVSAPICTTSEQAPDMPALIHRSVQVMFRQSALTSDREPYYLEAREGMPKLREVGKYLMLTALCNTREGWIRNAMTEAKEVVPRALDERPRYSAQVLLVAIRWLTENLDKLYLPNTVKYLQEVITPALEEHYAAMGDKAKDNRLKVRTEIDAVLDSMAMMATLTYQGKDYIQHGKHFVTTEDSLYIDAPTCHTIYKKFRAEYEREPAVIATISQFVLLLKTESYFEGEEYIPEISKTRMCLKLSKVKMAEKGLQVTLFDED